MAHSQIRLFIVEDNFLYSYMLETTLKECGNFKITSFTTAEECIEMLRNKPDLIILDYHLNGGMNGLEAFQIIHQKNPRVPVIILSSQTDVQVAADILHKGAFDYIEKKDNIKALEKLKASILKVTMKN